MTSKTSVSKMAILVFTIILIFSFASCNGNTEKTTVSATTHPGFPLVQFSTADFTGSGNCAQCHSRLKDSKGTDISVDSQWRSTMMANAAKDPFWTASVASEVAEFPALQAAIEDACATCHMPMARTQAVTSGKDVAVLGNGFLNSANELNKAAMDGNSCTVCHQIQAAGLGEKSSFGGNYKIDTSTNAPDRSLYGPFLNPVTNPMRTVVGFTPTQGNQISSAAICATCHNVYTPYIDNQGNVAGTFPEQVSYLEWNHSAYGGKLSCQDCHMPDAVGSAAISNNPTNLDGRSPVAQHHFVGGNAFMLNMLKNYVSELGITASTDQLDSTLARVATQIQSRTASVTITDSTLTDGALQVVLKISDQTGHKFPTGFPSRRAWIQLTVTDSAGKVVFESGKPNADGSISGNDADVKAGSYEPHYDIINKADQVQIYESIMQDVDGKVTYTLLRGAGYAKDNRLLPQGFDKNTAGKDFAVYGNAATDTNFIGGSDQITYQIAVKSNATYTITAELLYQSVGYQFTKSMFAHNGNLIKSFQEYYNSTNQTPLLVVSDKKTIP
jgi:hypothetical protein